MTGSRETANRATRKASCDASRQDRGGWGRVTEMLTKLSVIGILGLAGQQSISGYQAVYAGQPDMLGEQAAVMGSSIPGDLVFAPTGKPGAAMVITVADASGDTSTITIDEAGSVVID